MEVSSTSMNGQHHGDCDQPGIASAWGGTAACRLWSHCFLPPASVRNKHVKDALVSFGVSMLFGSLVYGWDDSENAPPQLELLLWRAE